MFHNSIRCYYKLHMFISHMPYTFYVVFGIVCLFVCLYYSFYLESVTFMTPGLFSGPGLTLYSDPILLLQMGIIDM